MPSCPDTDTHPCTADPRRLGKVENWPPRRPQTTKWMPRNGFSTQKDVYGVYTYIHTTYSITQLLKGTLVTRMTVTGSAARTSLVLEALYTGIRPGTHTAWRAIRSSQYNVSCIPAFCSLVYLIDGCAPPRGETPRRPILILPTCQRKSAAAIARKSAALCHRESRE